MQIYFIRHGKDDDRYRGGWSSLGLIDEGKKQASQLACFLKAHQQEYPISKIISSDLTRTVQTAKAIQKQLNTPLVLSKNWREMNNGDLAGMLNSVALEKYPGLFFNTLKIDECYPNGESPINFFNRIKQTFFELVQDQANDKVAIVTHSGVINIIYHIVNNVEWSNKSKAYSTPPASLHLLQCNENTLSLTPITL